MVTTASIVEAKTFFTKHNLIAVTNVTMLVDKKNNFESYFGKASFPTVLTYNKNWELKNKYVGEVKMDLIINSLTN